MTVVAAAIIVAIEARPKFGAKPEMDGSDATYVELVPQPLKWVLVRNSL